MQSTKFKNKYRTSSARAAWHDYTGGIYFVTICTKNREHYFGEITYDQNHEALMNLTDIGKNTDEHIRDISTHYPYAEIPLWVVMPNHLHCLVIIRNDVTHEQPISPVKTASISIGNHENNPARWLTDQLNDEVFKDMPEMMK